MDTGLHAAKTEIRVATARDASAIARLAGELNYPSTPEQMRDRLAAMENDPCHATFVAAIRGDEVVGWIHMSQVHSLTSEPRAEIVNLIVDSRYRSAGTGRLLVERGEEWARERGLTVVGVRSNVIRERAHAFYLRLGYTIAKSQRIFRKTL